VKQLGRQGKREVLLPPVTSLSAGGLLTEVFCTSLELDYEK